MTLVSSRERFKTLSDAQQQEERVKWKDTKCDQWSSCSFDYYLLLLLLLPIQQVIGTVVRWYCQHLTAIHLTQSIIWGWGRGWKDGEEEEEELTEVPILIDWFRVQAHTHTQSTHSGNHWPYFCWFVLFFFFPSFLFSFFPSLFFILVVASQSPPLKRAL